MSAPTQHKEIHSIYAEKLLFYGTDKNATKITIASQDQRALDFENIDHIEIDDVRVKQLTNEHTDADMITFSATNRIDFHSRTLDNVSITNGTLNGGNITGATLTNCGVDLPSGFESVLLETDANGTLTAGDATSKKVITDNTAILQNKTLDATCTISSATSLPANVVRTDNTQSITGQKTMTSPILNDALMGGTIQGPTGQNVLTLGSTTPATASSFLTDVASSGKVVAESGLLTGSTISHYLTSSPFTETTCLTLDGSGNVVCAGNLTADNIISGGGGTAVDMTIGTNEVGFPGGAYVNAIDAYSGNTLTLSADTTAIAGDLRLNGNEIENSAGNTVLTTNSGNTFASFSGGVGTGGNSTIDGYVSVVGAVKRRTAGGLYVESDWLSTDGTTTTVSNNIVSTGDITAGDGTTAEFLKVNNVYGNITIGPANSSYCHIDTDRPTFYLGKQIQVNGYLNPYTTGKDLGSSSYRWSLFADSIDCAGVATLGGATSGYHTKHVSEIIQAYNGGSTTTLALNYYGGSVRIGTSGNSTDILHYGDLFRQFGNNGNSEFRVYQTASNSTYGSIGLYDNGVGIFANGNKPLIVGCYEAEFHAISNSTRSGGSTFPAGVKVKYSSNTHYGLSVNKVAGGSTYYIACYNGTSIDGYFDGSTWGGSDERIKKDIEDIDDALTTIVALRPRKFRFKEEEGKGDQLRMGFIAQEAQTVLPSAVQMQKPPPDAECPNCSTTCFETCEIKEGEEPKEPVDTGVKVKCCDCDCPKPDKLFMNYSEIIPLNTRAIQQLYEVQTRELKQERIRNEALEVRLQKVETMLVSIMSKLA